MLTAAITLDRLPSTQSASWRDYLDRAPTDLDDQLVDSWREYASGAPTIPAEQVFAELRQRDNLTP